jgi:hypothetical protein
MAPRKRQLLDLLRTQQREAQPRAPASPAAPVASVPSAPAAPQSTLLTRTRQAPSWRPWLLRGAFVAVWLVLLVWLVSRLWPDGADPAGPGNTAGGNPPAAAAPESASHAAGAPPAPPAQGPLYGVLAITYQGAAHEQQAAATALELREALKPHPVTVRKYTKSGKTWFEVLIGQEADRARLDALVSQVRALSLASQPGKKPFSDAFVKTIPATTP